MNKDNSKYLLMLYQHCKDFREFFLESDYKNVFHSLYKIIKISLILMIFVVCF